MICLKNNNKRAPSERDPRLRGKVIQSTPFKKYIYNKVYETNNTFVTWNRNINDLKTFMGIN